MLAVIDRGGELLASDPDLLHVTIRVAADRAGPEVTFYEQLAARAVGRGEIEPGEAPRLVSFVILLLWGLSSMAALGPEHLGTALRTAPWAAEGCLRRDGGAPPRA